MNAGVTISPINAAGIRALFDPIFRLYHEEFSKPPYKWPECEDEQYRLRFDSLTADATFGAAVARIDLELVGFAYGRTLPPGTKWWDGFIEPVAKDITEEWPNRTFALIDFAVAERVQGTGVGRRLHDALLAGRGEERATLAMEPEAQNARLIYEHWGWQVIGRLKGPAADFAPEFDIMVLPLRQ
jgi:GNAT superfamily N-acetyltransferase